jgi:hypothetical protein
MLQEPELYNKGERKNYRYSIIRKERLLIVCIFLGGLLKYARRLFRRTYNYLGKVNA